VNDIIIGLGFEPSVDIMKPELIDTSKMTRDQKVDSMHAATREGVHLQPTDAKFFDQERSFWTIGALLLPPEAVSRFKSLRLYSFRPRLLISDYYAALSVAYDLAHAWEEKEDVERTIAKALDSRAASLEKDVELGITAKKSQVNRYISLLSGTRRPAHKKRVIADIATISVDHFQDIERRIEDFNQRAEEESKKQ